MVKYQYLIDAGKTELTKYEQKAAIAKYNRNQH